MVNCVQPLTCFDPFNLSPVLIHPYVNTMDQRRRLLPAIEFTAPYKRQAKPTSCTYMSSSPAEIKRMIAFHLRNCEENPNGPSDIKRLRLVNKEFSVIGAEFLLPVIHLTFQTKSFERLRTISQHPFYSKRVTHLQYEPDTFSTKYENEEEWITSIVNSMVDCDIEPFIVSQAKRERLLKSENEGNAAHCERRGFFNAYRAVDRDQIKIRHQPDPYNSLLIAQAIAQLPNLVDVTLSFESAMIAHANASGHAYKELLFPPFGDNCHEDPYGVMQLYSVLSGVASAGIQLKTLNCGKIDWRLLQLDDIKFGIMKRAIRHLETLNIMFYVGGNLEGDALRAEIIKCGTSLVDYQMCKFLSAAPDLKTLSLHIDRSGGLNLEYMVGTTTWASLRVLELDYIITSQKTLIDLLKRHGGTLKELGLHSLVLMRGSWASALPAVRHAVKLQDFRAIGNWTDRGSLHRLTIDTSMYSQGLPEAYLPQSCRRGQAVKEYVLGLRKECPLWVFMASPSL